MVHPCSLTPQGGPAAALQAEVTPVAYAVLVRAIPLPARTAGQRHPLHRICTAEELGFQRNDTRLTCCLQAQAHATDIEADVGHQSLYTESRIRSVAH